VYWLYSQLYVDHALPTEIQNEYKWKFVLYLIRYGNEICHGALGGVKKLSLYVLKMERIAGGPSATPGKFVNCYIMA
jgi:hypothetical protein